MCPESNDDERRTFPPIRDILKAADTTVYDFFKETTVIFQTVSKESWFQQLIPVPAGGLNILEKSFKQMESNFIILVILYTKFEKVSSIGRIFI